MGMVRCCLNGSPDVSKQCHIVKSSTDLVLLIGNTGYSVTKRFRNVLLNSFSGLRFYCKSVNSGHFT